MVHQLEQERLGHSPDDQKRLIPRRVTIETVFGCNARCPMCVIENPTERRKGVMPLETFKQIVDTLVPYRDQFEMFDLFALGEPLLDKHLFERIRYVKSKDFRRLAFSTNAQLLGAENRRALLESEIETVIFSLDGVRKSTHEKIRPRVTFERVVRNILSTIRMRDKDGYKTRFIIRFIKQPLNKSEWARYSEFWNARISRERGDMVTSYDMHSWAGVIATKSEMLGDRYDETIERAPCHHAFENMTILADGSMPLCAEDILDPQYGLGNVIGRDPIDVFNGEAFNELRQLHLSGRKNDLQSCRECTILYSEQAKSN